jgi:hypothetical protein
MNKSLCIHLQPIIVNIILILAAGFFRRGVMKDYGATGQLVVADRYYLYLTSARLFWLNLISAVMLETVRLGPTDSMLPTLGGLHLTVLILSVYCFYKISADFYTSLDVPKPKTLWGRQNKMFSRLFGSNFKSFWVVIVGLWLADFAGIWLISRLFL